jgi:hypothetical protein
MEAVQEALNSNVPIPASAGWPFQFSTPSFYIGAKTTDKTATGGYRILLALGSESFEEGWDECTAELNCLNGVTALEDGIAYTYAVFDDGSPKLYSPAGEIENSPPRYEWRSVENATGYILWVEDSEEEIIISDWYEAEEVGCLSEEGNLEPGLRCSVEDDDTSAPDLIDGSYNWQVLSWIPPTDGETNYKWSDPLSFTVAGPVPTTLTVEKAGEGAGTVISDPSGIDCGDTCSADFLGGVTLKASPDVGFEATWAGCDEVDPITNNCTVLMTEAKTVTAIFSEPPPRILTVELDGVGTGTVTSDPDGIDCSDILLSECAAPFVNTVTLTATPDPGSILAKLSGCDHVDPIAKECTVLMTEAKTVRVIFDSPF